MSSSSNRSTLHSFMEMPLMAQQVSLQQGSGHSGLCHPPSHTDGRTGRQLPLKPPSIMEALWVRPLKEDGVVMEEEERERRGGQEEGGMEALSPMGSTTDEDTDEDSEAEPPSVVCRKVSFADAFGLNLVSVKEFDNVEATVSEVSRPPEREAAFPLEEFYMSCLFTVPSSPEELDQRLQGQMVELESIELLPGTTMLRGMIRVVNLGYSKWVYARISLDCWSSYFDLLAEYVPGSSDRETDRFAFKYTLIPPFDREGTRLDFCLRYETSTGTFWANNKEMNYVLFCHQRGQAKELGPQVLEESGSYKSKRSCLKAKRRISAEEKTKESNSPATPSAGAQVPHKAQEAERQTADSAETHSLLHHEGHKALVDGVKSWPRGACLPLVQDDPSQRRQARRVYSHDSAGGQKISPPVPAPWCDSVSNRYNRQKQPNDSPPVLTYHQIPLLTLDWKSDTPQRWGAADMDDIWAGNAKQTRPKASVENIEATPSVNDLWETFLHGTDDTGDKETSAGDVWQDFLTEPSRQDHSGVPEAEWLQTAASVSPSNHREPQCSASSRAFQEVQVGTDAPATSHASATTSSSVDHQPLAEACVCNKAVTRDASERSQTNSVTHTLQECSLEGVRPVSGGSVDSSAECHMLAIWEQVGKRGEAQGAGGDERVAPLAAGLVTSSGESKTADMTEMPESQNASAVDRISQRAKLDEGLSFRGEGEVTGIAHNETRDSLAFRETIRQWTEDRESFVFSTSRETAGGIMTNCTENQDSTEEKLSRLRATEACEISQRHADEKRTEEFGLNPKSENPLTENERYENEIRPAQSHAHKLNPNQTCEENIRPSAVMEGKFKLDGSEKDTASSEKDQEGFKHTQVENTYCRKDTKRLIGEESKGAGQHYHKNVQLNSSAWQRGDSSVVSEVPYKQLRTIRAAEELHDLKEEEKNLLKSEMMEEKESLSCSGMNVERQEINPSEQSTHNVEIKVLHSDTFPADRHILNPTEAEGLRLKSSQDVMRGRREGTGREMSPEEITAEENVDAQTEPRRQPATPEGEEEDMRLREEDERRLRTEATRGSMGNVEDPRVERKNASAELKEREKVENPQRDECRKLSEGTTDLVTAEKTVALESRVEEAFIGRFAEDFVRGIWEEVFRRRAWDTNLVYGMKGSPADITCSLTDPNLRIHQGQEEATETSSKEQLPGGINQTHTDPDSSAHPARELAASSTESAQTISSAKEQENASEIRKRSIARQETGGQTEDCNRPALPFHQHPTFPTEKLKESDDLVRWSLHVLRHITRLLLCTLLVAGFFTILFLYDFPAFIALYVFSGCWWFYKWRRHRVAMHKGVRREFAETREGVEECGA